MHCLPILHSRFAKDKDPLGQTTVTENQTYRKKTSIVTRRIAGETLLVPIAGNLADMQRIFPLDRVAAFIWEQLDGSRNLAVLCGRILDKFDVEPETAREDLLSFITELRDAELIERISSEEISDGA